MARASLFVLAITASASPESAPSPAASCRPWCEPTREESHNLMFAGSWRQTTAEANAAPPCCGYDGGAWKHEKACTTRGESTWQMDRHGSYAGPRGGWARSGGYSCNCEPTAYYTWDAPNSCRLLAWDARAFCDVLGAGKRLVLIGDSTMGQAASTLMNAVILGDGGCQERISFALGDTLIQRNLGRYNRGAHWLDIVHRLDPDFVVLSAGAHITGENAESEYDQVVAEVLNQTRQLPRKIAARYAPAVPGRRLHVLWKTQAPGGCSSRPVAREASVTDCFEEPAYDDKQHWLQYSAFLARDARTVARFREAAWLDPHAPSIVDQRMLYWRADAHVDSNKTRPNNCLHHCLRTEVLSSTFPRVLLHEMAARTGRRGISTDSGYQRAELPHVTFRR